jgi:hypothetical protein
LSTTRFRAIRFVVAAEDDDAGAVPDVEPVVVADRGFGRAVGLDRVAGNHDVALRRERLALERVGHDPDAVVPEHRIGDDQIASRVGPRVADLAVLGHHVGDDRVTRLALADVEARVGAPRRVRMLEHPPLRVERVDPVVTVAISGEVRPAVPEDAGPVEAVVGVVPSREVLDRDTVGTDDVDAVLAFEVAVEDRPVAVDAADHDPVGRDGDRLVVHARRDEHEIAGARTVHRALDRLDVTGHPDRASRRGEIGCGLRAAARGRDVGGARGLADGHGACLPLARRAVERAVVPEVALVLEVVGVRLTRTEVPTAEPPPLVGGHVVAVAALVHPPDGGSRLHLDARGPERVVADPDGDDLARSRGARADRPLGDGERRAGQRERDRD